MSPVDVRPRPASAGSGIAHLPYGLAAIGAIALAVAAAGLAREPAFVDRVDIVNRSPYALSVDVRGEGGGGWVPLGYADQEASTAVREVLDQGGQWTFRFSAQGRAGGQFTVSRTDLGANRWHVDVPDAVGDRLRRAGAPPSP
ncbi:MAG: hypothetical protein QOG87_3744 [Actinomycetota bacterium]|jgi:hypothetical protein